MCAERITETIGTLTHSANVDWADSSTDDPAHNGLTEFGREVIRTMNRLGMMVDISHVSDRTFYDALSASEAPLVATHSCCRALCDTPRNLSDEMIKSLAAAGGVLQVNFHVGFVSQAFRNRMKAEPEIQRFIDVVEGRADLVERAQADLAVLLQTGATSTLAHEPPPSKVVTAEAV